MSDESFFAAGSKSSLIGPSKRRESAAQVSYLWLKDRIGAVPRDAGMFISEADVAQGSGTGRTPAREALQRLETEGYLQIIPRKGIFIPPISNADITALMDARHVVEEWCVERTTIGGKLSDGILGRFIDQQERLIGEDRSFIEADRLFHRTIVTNAGNPVLSTFYEQLRDRQVRMGIMALSRERDRALHVLTEHREIADAIQSGDAEAARIALGKHLDTTLSVLIGGS